MACVTSNGYSLEDSWTLGLLTVVISTAVYVPMKFYDIPVRKWLPKSFYKYYLIAL